jgi:alpha-beta hydrolase superfamily lysophospholipase
LAEPVLASFTAGDGYVCRYRRYEPAEPRAHLVCIHGIESHGGWYGESCGRFRDAGFRVSFLDRRGSGMNSEARGDTPGFRRLLDDLADFLKPLAAERAALPVYLLAISWSGKLALALQRRHPGLVDGLILVCPGVCPRVRHSFGERCSIAMSRLVVPRRRFRVPIADPAYFTASVAGQQFIKDDALALREATARLFVESVRLDFFLRFFPPRRSVPTLLCLAGEDRIIDNIQTEQAVRRLVPAELTVNTYEDAHHTLEFEPVRDRFVADVVNWIQSFGDREPNQREGSPREIQ